MAFSSWLNHNIIPRNISNSSFHFVVAYFLLSGFFRICSLNLPFISLKLHVRYLFPLLFIKMQLKLPQLRKKNILPFFTLFILYILSLSVSSEYLSVSLLSECVVFNIATEERAGIKRKKTSPHGKI